MVCYVELVFDAMYCMSTNDKCVVHDCILHESRVCFMSNLFEIPWSHFKCVALIPGITNLHCILVIFHATHHFCILFSLLLCFTQDWDANGTIDFAEFVFSFTSWVDVDEE